MTTPKKVPGAWFAALPMLFLLLSLSACGGGGGGSGGGGAGGTAGPGNTTNVQLSWSANRETAVNRPGGGYKVYHGTTPGFDVATARAIDVPYASGASAPTRATLALPSGSHYVKITAYSVLNPAGSAPSAEVTVNVP